MDRTPNLDMPFILPSQAQKHVTHNEALWRLDTLVQLAVLDRDLASPPATPSEGDRYLVAAGATGEWDGWDLDIACYSDGAWARHAAADGWLVWVDDDAGFVFRSGGAWIDLGAAIVALQNLSLVGIGTMADATNPLSAKLNNALLTAKTVAEGGDGDLRIKANKEAMANTVSYLFQSGYSGRAEFGLTGSDDFTIKVSPDGSAWTDALSLEKDSGGMDIAGQLTLNASAYWSRWVLSGDDIYWRSSANGGTTVHEILKYDHSTGTLTVAPNEGDTRPPNLWLGPHNVWLGYGAGGAAMEIAAGIAGDRPAFFDFRATDSHPDWSARFIRGGGVAGEFAIANYDGAVQFITHDNVGTGGDVQFGVRGVYRAVVSTDGLHPHADNASSLGKSGARWSEVWAANGTIQTSDARDKTVERNVAAEEAVAMLEAIDPVFFTWKVGSREEVIADRRQVKLNPANPRSKFTEKIETELVTQPGARTHAGFIAQEVKAALDALELDFGAWGLTDKDDPDSQQWLRPDQLIPILWAALKETRLELGSVMAKLDTH